MLERDIIKPNGEVYMTVAVDGNQAQFKNFGQEKWTINFDVKTLDQVIPALQEINFFFQAGNGKNI
jgi:hypothetical protein